MSEYLLVARGFIGDCQQRPWRLGEGDGHGHQHGGPADCHGPALPGSTANDNAIIAIPASDGLFVWELAGLAGTAEKATQTIEDRQGMGNELPRPGSFTTAALHKPALEENIPVPWTVKQVEETQSAQAASTMKLEEKKLRNRTFGGANGLGPKVTSSFGVGPTPGTVLTAMTYCVPPGVVIRQMEPQPDKKLTAAMMADFKSDLKRDAMRDWWLDNSWP